VGRKSQGINKPKDLEGKILGAPAPDGAYAQWPIFVKANNIDASKVEIKNVGFPVREPMLVSGKVDAITGFAFSSYLNVAKKVPPGDATVFLMSDYGVKLYGNAVMVHPKFAADHPEAVTGFVRALVKGINYTVANPDTAIEAVLKRNALADKATELERLKYALNNNYLTAEVKANGYGAIDPKRMNEAIDQLALTFKFESKPKIEDFFDASYLPSAAERAVK
jgi:NitT/TauT family transport system substrate-binding protein